MTLFAPSTELRLGRVRWDNSYSNVMWFSTESAQATAMQLLCPSTYAYNDFKYIRAENAVYVPTNAENIYTYNYCMYKNANYGSKWFYAFIKVEYVNAGTAKLTLEQDVFQTWLFDWTRTAQYVMREHASVDTIGANVVPEPLEWYIQYSMNTVMYDFKTNGYAVIVETTQSPNVYHGSDTVQGHTYAGIYHGGGAYAFNTIASASVFLENLAKAGAIDAVTAVYMYPKDLLGAYTAGSPLPDTALAYQHTFFTNRPSTLHGYTPRNNKLFTWPFCFCRVTNNNQAITELAYERWVVGPQQTGYAIAMFAPLGPTAQAVCIPELYEGVAYNFDSGFSLTIPVTCEWTYDGFNQWLGANWVRMAMNVVSGALHGSNNKEIGAVKGAVTGLVDSGINAIVESNQYIRVPTQVRGGFSNNDAYAANALGIQIEQVAPIAAHAALIDDFFDRYGYQTNDMKLPNFTGRRSWNYVQLSGASFAGNVPADAMASINETFNRGVTLWHNTNVGNYALANDII